MEERLITLVKENTKRDNYEDNNASNLSNIIGLSRNSISSYLNDYFNQGRFVKINTRPVLFLEKSELEKRYNIKINKLMFASLDELDEYAKTCGRGSKDFRDLIGYNGSLRKIIESCKASISYPPHGLPILLNGPTGTGKSFIIEKMFEYGKNNGIFSEKAKFVHVNCSEYANNPELITANLFGYKRGAFTGADNDNPGLIKVADGGMLFLDEVHCLKPECQEKLFLFMDKGNYHVLGDSENEYHSNVFLAFATTENPKEVLLKTLLRRIPIQMEIPSLSKRSEMEKSNIIVRFLENEAKLDTFSDYMKKHDITFDFFLSHYYAKDKISYLHFHSKQDIQIQNIILQMYEENNMQDSYSNTILCHLFSLLLAYIQRKNQENTEITTNIEKNENLKIIQYINDHYKTISLEKISQHFHYSIPYCSKWIKEKTGYSYYELLTHIKLQKGKQLLLNTTLSISQISKQLSYKNPESFIRTFKKYEAITPQAYRKNEQ